MKRFFPICFFVLFCLCFAANGQVRVACIGNSITYGYGIKGRDSLSYPAQLQDMLGAGYVVHNYGVSGRTLLKKGDYPYWNEKAFQQARDWQPNIVVIMLGTNDTKPWNWKYGAAFGTDYRDLLEVFRQLPSHPVIWAALPVPVFKPNRYGIRDSVVKAELPIIRKVAREEHVHLMNLYSALKPYGRYFFDGVHPNRTGAYYLARAIYREIRPGS